MEVRVEKETGVDRERSRSVRKRRSMWKRERQVGKDRNGEVEKPI